MFGLLSLKDEDERIVLLLNFSVLLLELAILSFPFVDFLLDFIVMSQNQLFLFSFKPFDLFGQIFVLTEELLSSVNAVLKLIILLFGHLYLFL